MFFLFSRSHAALGARALISLAALSLPLASSGCTDVACFEWTEAEGMCPAQSDALVFFEDPFCGASDIQAINSDGEFDDGACCYEVSKRDDDEYYTCGGVTVGVGPSTAVSVGSAGGVGGVGGGMGGVGGAGAGGAGGAGGSSECIRCNQAISGGDPALLCADSGELYDAYMMCLCADVCAMVCADYCAGQMKTDECINCESDTVGGCGNQLSACASDM
jgi:hypothetical protein